jgi:hypothetical protein
MPDLSDPLGPPKIVTGVDYMDALARLGYNVENMSSPLPVMSKIAQSATSLVDNQYNQALQWAKSKADTQEAVARANNIDSQTNFANQALDYRLKGLDLENKQRQQSLDLFPLDVQAKQQILKENQFKLQEAQRNADEIDKAHGEYQAWHDELAQLDPTDPDYDNKIASIMAKYPEASTNPSTQRLIAPLLQQQNVKRSQSFVVQQRTDQLNQLRGFQQNGLIPPDTDIQKEVAAGNGQSMVNRAKQQSSLNRLQTIIAYGSPSERLWAQNQINDITGVNRGPNEAPPPMFGPNGDLNPGSEALLSTIERRIGISPVAPGAKKETKVTTDETGTKTETIISGQPVTAQDIAKPAQPAVTTDMPTTPEEMQKDPVFQSIFSDLRAGKLALPGNPKPGTPEFTTALFAEYSKRKAAAPAPQRASKAGRPGAAKMQEGGLVTGTEGPDKVPAMLTSGEYVVNKDAVQNIGLPILESLIAGTRPTQSVASQSLFGQPPSQWGDLPTIRPQLTQMAQAPTTAPRATPVETPAVTTGPATTNLDAPMTTSTASTASTANAAGTTLTPQDTTGDAFLNAHYLGDGRLSGLATNFGHDVNGRPDTYMLSKLGGGSRVGAFGTDVVNPNTVGASIPVQTFRAFIGNPNDPQVRQRVQSGRVQVEVTAPNGKKAAFPIVDLGPGKGEHASLDLTGSAMRQLGMNDNFGAVYRIVSF